MERLLDTVRDVAACELPVPADVVTRVFARIRAEAEKRGEKVVAGLTQRDIEIVTMFSQSMSYASIAEARGVKPVTIRNAIYSIQSKLDVGSKPESTERGGGGAEREMRDMEERLSGRFWTVGVSGQPAVVVSSRSPRDRTQQKTLTGRSGAGLARVWGTLG